MLKTAEQVERLLGRDYRPDYEPVRRLVQGKSVLVTGAGGSIGSQLCLQLIALQPRTLILYEMSEHALYEIDRALPKTDTRVIPMLGNLNSPRAVGRMLETFGVEFIYHAAAYKHVPLVERNPVAGLENNLAAAGTLAEAAHKVGVKNLVLVSSDKAVNPTNVMGASKRLSEYLVLAEDPSYKVVRFGNVLWSSGSVLPLFYEQLMSGQKVTITHPDVSRYFMSIREAVSLILQSTLIDGRICVLDMGHPVKISQIAQRLAEMLGKPLEIEWIGLRPGEKLHEELTLGDRLMPSRNPMIHTAEEDVPSKSTLYRWMVGLNQSFATLDVCRIRTILADAVPGYAPSCGIIDPVWLEENVFTADRTFDDCFAPTR